MAHGSEVTELIGIIRKTGHKVTKTGNSKHWKVLRSNGSVVVDANGPIIISSSPSVNRWREMAVQRLMNPNIPGGPVLKADPFKATLPNKNKRGPDHAADQPKKNKGASKLADPAVQAARDRAVRARSDRNRENTAKLRARWEPIVVKLGGWAHGRTGSGLRVGEMGDVMFAWARNRGRMELPKTTLTGAEMTPPVVAQAVRTFRTPGGILSEKTLELFGAFVDDVERDCGRPVDTAKAASRYMGFVREAKGISNGPTSPAPSPARVAPPPVVPPAAPEPLLWVPAADEAPDPVGGTAPRSRAEIGPLYEPDTFVAAPELAMEVLYEIAVNARILDPEAKARHLALAREIAELELNRRKGK